ncbi:transporter suffix domain-containing protein [Desulfosediminicola sp.]|uniref:transporter suffix domain-containing protein n=1 Tax=Desulfosediminicola sp. TaxID=2886825 RepID=UPI003AF2CCBE
MTDAVQPDMQPVAGWRFKFGISLFVLSILLPVLGVPLVTVMELSSTSVATISGILLVSAEVLGVAAVAVLGKSGYAYIKKRVLGFFKRYGPPAEVSRTRYRIGLVLFALPLFFGWLAPYAAGKIPAYSGNEPTFALIGDLLTVISLFVLGGDFWDKLRSLFFHDAKAIMAKQSGKGV